MMTSQESNFDKKEIPTLQNQLEVIESFIQSQLEGTTPFEDEAWGEDVMVKEAPMQQLGNGTMLWCKSKTGGEADESDFVKVSAYGIDNSSLTLYLNSNGSYDFSSTGSDGDELYDHEEIPQEEAVANPDFIATVGVLYKLITEEVPKPKREFPRIPLPVAVVLVEGSDVEKMSAPVLEVGAAEEPYDKGQDAILADKAHNLYGAFDGVGSQASSEIAARLVATTVQAFVAEANPVSPQEAEEAIVAALVEAHLTIVGWNETSNAGSTTATVAQVLRYEGEDFLVWASVGDTRLYLKTENIITQISKDEGEGSKIHNSLGRSGYFNGVKQHGIVKLPHTYEIVLCSDGITGDRGNEILDPSEIAQVLNESPTPQTAAQRLIDVSRKKDDKAVVVIKK